jgi:hypothetical protein
LRAQFWPEPGSAQKGMFKVPIIQKLRYEL